MEYLRDKGLQPIGMEPVAVGVSADAHHITTPSVDGPKAAIWQALAESQIDASDLHPGSARDGHSRRLHGADRLAFDAPRQCTGDGPEGNLRPRDERRERVGTDRAIHGLRELPPVPSARSIGQVTCRSSIVRNPRRKYMSLGAITPLAPADLNGGIRALHRNFVFNEACPAPSGFAGKLSMGIGGIDACVISRPLGS